MPSRLGQGLPVPSSTEDARHLATLGAGMASGGAGLGLADPIRLVRSELERAAFEGQTSRLAFVPGPVELEFGVGFEEEASADAGFRVWWSRSAGKVRSPGKRRSG